MNRKLANIFAFSFLLISCGSTSSTSTLKSDSNVTTSIESSSTSTESSSSISTIDSSSSITDSSSVSIIDSSSVSSSITDSSTSSIVIEEKVHNKSNYHTHTYRCNHANGTDKEYIESAIKNGYDLLGFSDHVMLPWTNSTNSVRGRYEQINDYFSSLRNLKEEYKDQIDILIGFECEYDETFKEYYQYLLDSKQCDYLIFGNHYTNYSSSTGTFSNVFVNGNNMINKQMAKKYISNAMDALNTGLFRVFAHPDYFMYSFDDWDDEIALLCKDMCLLAKDKNVALEINQGAYINGKIEESKYKTPRYNYPYDDFWDIVSEVGNEVITSVDAHTPSAFNRTDARNKAFDFAKKHNVSITEDLKIESKEPIEITKNSTITVINGEGSSQLGKYEVTNIKANVPEGKYFDYWKVNGVKDSSKKEEFSYINLSNQGRDITYEAVFMDTPNSYYYLFDKVMTKGSNKFGILTFDVSADSYSSIEIGASNSRGVRFYAADQTDGNVIIKTNIPFVVNHILINASQGSGSDSSFSISIDGVNIASNVSLTNQATDYSYDVDNLSGELVIVLHATISGKLTYIKSISIN